MKILQISTYFLPNIGGIERVAYDFSRILRKNGHETQIICFNNNSKTVIDEYEGQKVIRVGYNIKLASQAICLKYFFILKKTIKEFNPDVIHIHLPNPLIAFYLLLLNVKCKVTVHWHSDIIKQKKLKIFYKHIEKRILEKSSKIIATSQIYAENSESLKNFIEKVEIIPNIVDDTFLSNITTEEYKAIEAIKERYKGKKIIFFIGVHREYKGITYLIEAAKYLSQDYFVVIAGNGPMTSKLKKMVQMYGLTNIDFIGRISDEEKKMFLYASDVFAFPSITKNEAFGIALAEALFCGLPAVTFTIKGSGVNWVNQNNKTGIEVSQFDPKQYAIALQNVSKLKYGAAAKQWADENFTERAIYKKVIDFFDNVKNSV